MSELEGTEGDGDAFENAPVGLAYVDVDGVWLKVNPCLCEILGYTRDELVGMTFRDVTYDDDRETVRTNVRCVLAGEVSRCHADVRCVRKDGSIRWVHTTLALAPGSTRGGAPIFACAIVEIDLPPGEGALIRAGSETRSHRPRRGVGEYALFLLDPDGLVTFVNSTAVEITGWSQAEMLGQHIRAIFTPEDRGAGVPEQELAVALYQGKAPDERWQQRKDGARFYAVGTVQPRHDPNGVLIGYLKMFADFTEWYRAEQRLEWQAALIDLSFDAIIVLEPESDRIIFWSRGAEQTYGWTAEEAEGKRCGDLLQTEFPVSRQAAVSTVLAIGRWEGDLKHRRKDGQQIIVSSRWALQHNSLGRPTAVLEVNRDVTAQRRMEAQLEAHAAAQERIVDTLQRALLMMPPPDIYPGLTIKALYQGAHDDVLVGGDFFDIFAVTESRIALVVGDATGKGLQAATYTAEVKFALRALLRENPEPDTALNRLNRFVVDKERLDPQHLGQSYIALALVVIDTITGIVTAARAGLEPPFLLRTSGEMTVFDAGGPLLGVIEGSAYQSQQETMGIGDIIAMSTDGLTEARHPERRRDFFGFDGLADAIREEALARESLAEAELAVLERVRQFTGGTIGDDVCLLMARRRPL